MPDNKCLGRTSKIVSCRKPIKDGQEIATRGQKVAYIPAREEDFTLGLAGELRLARVEECLQDLEEVCLPGPEVVYRRGRAAVFQQGPGGGLSTGPEVVFLQAPAVASQQARGVVCTLVPHRTTATYLQERFTSNI
jgi:hypothetical protein